MKNVVFLLIFLGLFCQKKPGILWIDASWDPVIRDEKLTMIDFWGTTCQPCHRLFDETFQNPDIIAYANTHFHAYKIDVWLEENADIKEKYHVNGVPTLVFLNEEGQEVDRLVGFRPAEKMLSEWQRIVADSGTYPALKREALHDSLNPDKWIRLGEKLNAMRSRGDDEGMLVWERTKNLLPETDPRREYVMVQLAVHNMWKTQDPSEFEKMLNTLVQFPNTKVAMTALIQYARKTGQSALEGAYEKLLADIYVKKQKELDPTDFASRMNAYAWRMTQLEMNLSDALEKIKLGISVLPVGADPDVRAGLIDTEAEVLWKLGQPEAAIEMIEKSIALEPENKYYREQKKKFYTQRDLYR